MTHAAQTSEAPPPADTVARFLTPLRVEAIEDASSDGRGTWRLLDDLLYDSPAAQRTIAVPSGFVTDFASVPRVPLAFWLTGGTGHKAAVVHDWLYTTHTLPRDTADAVFREALKASGVPAWRAWLMHAGVRIGGSGPWQEPGQAQTVDLKAPDFDHDIGPMY